MSATLTRLAHEGYGQLELNQVAFRRDGRIEAQCKIADGIDYLENGMLLAVDKVNKEVKYPTVGDKLIGLNYTTEHMYDERKVGLKDFRLEKGTFYPRIGYLAVGERFTTNCVSYMKGDTDTDANAFADEDAIAKAVAAGTVFGCESADGTIKLVKDLATATIKLQAVEYTTMPDGQAAIKFVVIA